MAEQGCKLFIYGVDQNFENSGLQVPNIIKDNLPNWSVSCTPIIWLKAVQAEFEKFGVVTDVYNTGKGYAFVTFDRKEDAEMVSGTLDVLCS